MSDITRFRVADLSQTAATEFDLRPDATRLARIAADLDLDGLRKLRFAGRIRAEGRRDWLLTARLGATVTQPCVVTLEPVVTRIDTDIRRHYVADWRDPDAAETEMPDDDERDPLGTEIDIDRAMVEALALALPAYPRREGAELVRTAFAEPGLEPLGEEDVKPFAGLANLRDVMKKEE